MILGDVLRVLSTYCNAFGIDHKDLYVLLFEEEDLNLDQTVKNTFGKRGLNQWIYKELVKDEGFLHLAKIIDTRLLSVLGSHQEIYRDLYVLVENDTHFSDSDKQQILSSFDPDDQKQLAQFIALCIICGNYNLPRRKSKQPVNQTTYGINLKTFTANPEGILLEHDLWEASQRDFFASRRRGGRFSSFHIITQLLPKGFIAEPDFLIKGKTENSSIQSVLDLCAEDNSHIAVIGNGGIGKTTFLHQLMSESYAKKVISDAGETILQPLPYQTGKPIPFFIELNRCPESIGSWYNDNLRKTNFITRYIAQILENHASLDSVDPKTLDSIEKDFQKTPANGIPRYLLLLDGFNEVKSSQGHSVRTFLSNEISVLSHYPNIRIITTSRETQAAYYASEFKNIRLVGLEDEDITAYLRKCNISETKIGLIMACKPLVECLRIPLYICMFCAEDTGSGLPETPGEILYNFFHRNSSFYNIRSRAADTRTNPLDPFQTAFVLDFILPYIGWQMEMDDCFSVNETAFKNLMETAIFSISSFCQDLDAVPFSDFYYRTDELLKTAASFQDSDHHFDKAMIQKATDCIYSYLGIMYQYQTTEGYFYERNRYAFSHHQFRDYFSAMWDIQLLTLIQCLNTETLRPGHACEKFDLLCNSFLNTHYWQHHKTEFISQILMEHRNRPRLHPKTQNWYLPRPECDEERVLTNVLSFCRRTDKMELHYLLANILSAILNGRKELSGVDLSSLNLTGCNFFNVTCSRQGKTAVLAANFEDSILNARSFEPENHQNDVIDYLYHDSNCFTLDNDGRLKCWDILSGKMEYEYQFPNPTSINDFSSSGFLKISPDGRWLAAKIQQSHPGNMQFGIQLLELGGRKRSTPKLLLDGTAAKAVNYFAFTEDSCGVLLLIDYTTICCFSLEDRKNVYTFSCPDLKKDSLLYARSITSSIYAFIEEYDPYNELKDYPELEEWDLEEEKDSNAGIPCRICEIFPETKQVTVLHSFATTPGLKPTATYLPQPNAFLYYDYAAGEIMFFDCALCQAVSVLSELTLENQCQPSYIHPHPRNPEEYYVMYPSNCYLVDLQIPENPTVIMKYPVAGLLKLLNESGQEGKLYFKTEVIPDRNRFIVNDGTMTYEWDSEANTLLPRYNPVHFSYIDLMNDSKYQQCILAQRNNSVTVFSGSPAALKYSFCFNEPNYHISNCCFNSSHQLLALTFSSSNHEKIFVLNISNSEESCIFSTMHPNETIINLCYSYDEMYLLISTNYQCCEYVLDSKKLFVVRKVKENERLAGANYQEKDIDVAILQTEQDLQISDRCEHYRRRKYRNNIYYKKNGYYLLPKLTHSLMHYLILNNKTIAIQESFESCLIISGFFPLSSNNLFQLPTLKTYFTDGKTSTCTILPYQRFYFKWAPIHPLLFSGNGQIISSSGLCFHQHYVKNQKIQILQKENTINEFNYTFLDEASGKAIFTHNPNFIFYHDHYTECTYEKMEEALHKKNSSLRNISRLYYAVPYRENQMMVCYENYQLMVLDTKTGEERYGIPYTPGLAVCGCNFRGAAMDEELKEKIKENGGRIR